MNIDKQTFNTLDVLYDDKKWGKRIDPDEWNANFKVLEQGHNEFATKLNQQVTDIDTAIQAATSNGGQNISVQYGVGTETLQDALDNVVSDINNRYTKNEVDASIGSNTNSLIANAEYNESTGVFTFTRKDGSSVVIDTVIEKVPASMALVNESDGSVSLVITNQDGSQTKTNVTSLIEDTVINSSDTINATSVTDAVKKVTTYTLVIKPNSIGLSHIDSALTAKFEEAKYFYQDIKFVLNENVLKIINDNKFKSTEGYYFKLMIFDNGKLVDEQLFELNIAPKEGYDLNLSSLPLIAMPSTNALNTLGFIPWLSQTIGNSLHGMNWFVVLVILVLAYFYSHYFFASSTAHVSAMYAAFLAVALAAHVPPMLAALMLGFFGNLMAATTHYSSGPAPILFGSGYVKQSDWWRLNFILGLIYIVIWVGVGSLWMKLLGMW